MCKNTQLLLLFFFPMNAKTAKANPTELQVKKKNKERLNDAHLWIRSIEMTGYRSMNHLD